MEAEGSCRVEKVFGDFSRFGAESRWQGRKFFKADINFNLQIDHQRRDDLDSEGHYASQAASENVSEEAVDSTMDVKLEYKLVESETSRPLTSEKEKEEDDIDSGSSCSKVKIITI